MKISHQSSPVAIVIPVYQSVLSVAEQASLRQCMLVLHHYPVKIVKPRSLDLDLLKTEYPAIEMLSFEDEYFTGTDAYNRLLTSLEFYKTFLSFEFILIYQLDAYVFRDELLEWCKKDYDYIGAPSLHQEEFNALGANSKNKYAKALTDNRIVFNGGLSLRRIPAFIRYLKIYNWFYPAWLGNEDMLFSQEATRLIPMKLFLKLPAWMEALHFSFEKSPAATFELTSNQLPFACHAWERYDPDFWAPYIGIKA
ncbi:DUF5672 family protein [Dyadobacter sp. NIV53]|uniref:DUF5672 family protein n=1 Tax=Dyadobacter sp. NIV53 TaxID=2861765 RepID=UPI001E417CA5|nr:DUF5672 family protein [Dyadobacter sp. NIV53]